MGLSLVLPGSGWIKSTPRDYPAAESERWENEGKSLLFAAFLFDDYKPEGAEVFRSFAEDITYDFQITPLAETREEEFHSYPAIRMEGVGLGAQETFRSDYRFVEYWLEKDEGRLLVVVGAQLSAWEDGGAAQVEAILDGLRFER
jgi:hypothetical protein